MEEEDEMGSFVVDFDEKWDFLPKFFSGFSIGDFRDKADLP